jgi:hypothetical protein
MKNSTDNQLMLKTEANSWWETNGKMTRYTLVVLFSLVLLIWGFRSEAWYDYGNGLVNLDRVSLIRSNMNITGVKRTGERIDLIDAPITLQNVWDLEKAIRDKGPFESVSYAGEIMFDQFTVKLPGFDGYYITYSDDSDIISLAEAWHREILRVRAQVQ